MSIQNHISRLAVVLTLIAAFIPFSAQAGEIGKPVTKGGFTFINFDPSLGTLGTGSNANGISDRGHAVDTVLNSDGSFTNFVGTPNQMLPLNLGPKAMALGINAGGAIVGTNNGVAFWMPPNGTPQNFSWPANATAAFGISDMGHYVGQYTNASGQTPGFYLANIHGSGITINAPSGPNAVNAQGVNNFGLIVGFYVGTDGNFHGFMANLTNVTKAMVVGTPIPDPVIPVVAGEPGATFVFSQILAVNDAGIAVGYYGDSTTSQHGFLYNTNTGKYTFLDDPSEQFANGVEVTQITGITDSGELTGFYTDANAAAHSFTACPPDAFCANFPHDLP